MKTSTLTQEQLHKMDAYWRAANYLSVGSDVSLRQSTVEAAPNARGYDAHAAGTLGHHHISSRAMRRS
jgi:phosphoketolase